jgi:hypothetical protein
MGSRLLLALLLLTAPGVAAGAEAEATTGVAAEATEAFDFDFDVERYARKAWEAGGFLEGIGEYLRANRDATVYRLNEPGGTTRSFNRFQARAELSGLYRAGRISLHSLLSARYTDDIFATSSEVRFFELYASAAPTAGTRAAVGKRTLRWGTGYAFNPTGFLERPKDPLDPELSREGFILADAAFTRGFAGALQVLTLQGVLLPVTSDVNDAFGPDEGLNAAARAYLLYRDTDLYFMGRLGKSRPDALGMAVSRNLAENFAIHAEIAWFATRAGHVPGTGGADGIDAAPATRKAEPLDLLAGLRYLTAGDTTWIVEYFRSGAGYTRSELARVLEQAEEGRAFSDLRPGAGRIRPMHGAPQPMRDYLYVRAMRNEPLGLLYTRAGANAIVNLQDGSASIMPEIIYTGLDNLELRGRFVVLTGGEQTDFGERLNRWRVELRVRYLF